MKLILIILLVVLIMLVAFGISKQYKNRTIFFTDLLDFLNKYDLNIGFKKEKLLLFCKSYVAKDEMKDVLMRFIKHLELQTEFEISDVNILQEDEREFVKDLFLKLGSGDYQTEKEQLKIFKDTIKSKIDESIKLKNKYCPMIIKLSFLFGICLAILLI